MKADWEVKPLGEITNISIGKTPSRDDKRYWDADKNTKNIWLSIADLNSVENGFVSDSKEYISDAGAALFKPVPANTLIMSFKLSIGKLAFTGCELRTNEAIAALDIKDENKITKEYLRHFLSSRNWDKIAGNDEKVKGKTLNKAKLKELKIVVPSLAEQQRIVEILDEAFAGLETARENVSANLENSKELFQSVLNESLNGAEEKGWEVKSLGDLCDILDKDRRPITKKDRCSGPYPYYGATGIVDYVDGYLFDEPLVLLGEDGAKWESGEKSAFAINGKTWVNNHAHVIRPNREKLLDSWLIYYLNFADLSDFITGVTVPKLNQFKMKSIEVLLPPLGEQRQIVEKLDALHTQTDRLQQEYSAQLADLDDLRQSLLEKAFAGELT